jgi:hypothetical protein
MGCLESVADLSVAAEKVFIGGQLLERHWAPGMQLVRADTDLGAKAKLTAVGE